MVLTYFKKCNIICINIKKFLIRFHLIIGIINTMKSFKQKARTVWYTV